MSMISQVVADPEVTAFARDWGRNFIRLSFAGAVLALALIAWEGFRKAKPDNTQGATGDTKTAILTALTAFLEALGKLPTWLAIYGAGYGLLWLTLKP